jgi:hypothetical protein
MVVDRSTANPISKEEIIGNSYGCFILTSCCLTNQRIRRWRQARLVQSTSRAILNADQFDVSYIMTTNEATASDLEAFLIGKRKSDAHLGSDDLEILKRERNNLSYLIYAYFVLVAAWFYVIGAYSSMIGSHPSLRLFASLFLIAGATLLNNRYRKLESYLYLLAARAILENRQVG